MSLISRSKDVLTSIIFLALTQSLILVIATIAPGYAASILGIPVVEFPIIFVAPAAFGTVLGSWFLVKFLHQHSKNSTITIGIFLSSAAMLLLPYFSKAGSKEIILFINLFLPDFLRIDLLHIIIALAFILGLSNSFIFVPANTLLQEKTSEEFRGKIYGFLSAFVGILSLLPIIIVGGLADIIGVGSVITGIGVFLFIVGILRFLP